MQFILPDWITNDTIVYYELGEVEYDSELDDFKWLFTIGIASDTYESLYTADHTYTQGTINKPSETDWIPIHYDVPIPEPSISIFLCIGALMLLPLREL